MNNVTVIFYPELVELTKCKDTAMFLSQAVHLQLLVNNGKGGYLNGFVKSFKDWVKECLFTRYQVENAKKKLSELGILRSKVISIPSEQRTLRSIYGISPVTHFEINLEKVKELLSHTPRLLEKLGITQPKRATTNDKQQPAPTPKQAEQNLSTKELAALAWAHENVFWKDKITSQNIKQALQPQKAFAQQYAVANRKSIDTADKPATNTADKPSTCKNCNDSGMLMFKNEQNEVFATKCHHDDKQLEYLKNLNLQLIPPRK